MGGYGKAAIQAVELMRSGKAKTLREAWDTSVSGVFPSYWSQEKGCPRCTFFGLCQEGMVKGIEKDFYTRSEKNRKYAVKAVRILERRPHLASDSLALWRAVTRGRSVSHNDQMDVVTELWNANLITRTG